MACLNPQDVGAPEDETFIVSTEGAKQPEDLATAARHRQAKVVGLGPTSAGASQIEHRFCVRVVR
ncbi:hypothetical protein ABFG93_11310 [Pseudalkalibacillus hwajinpoensis]|uniref:hypothetical protein n=1 Tax=Guptibacillus hwajinpoensis TaxID=208199 RepID=UPI00325AB2B4